MKVPPILERWLRYNIVGLAGTAVQLTSIAILHRLFPAHYLWDAAAALELTLLNNFNLHLRYTWRDRNDRASRLQQFLRYHLTNGSISLAGNLALMRLFVGQLHIPVVVANLLAILTCGLANFALAHTFSFRVRIASAPVLLSGEPDVPPEPTDAGPCIEALLDHRSPAPPPHAETAPISTPT